MNKRDPRRALSALLCLLVLLTALSACSGKDSQTGTARAAVRNVRAGYPGKTAAAADEDLPVPGQLDPRTDWADYDALIQRIREEEDPARRVELIALAEDVLLETGCLIPLYFQSDYYLQKPRVSGVYADASGVKHFTYTAVEGSDTLRVQFSTLPGQFDPALLSTLDTASMAELCFTGLYARNAAGEPVPALAESLSQNGLVCTVTLREGLTWSDGSKLVARDFAYSWKRAAKSGGSYAYLLSAIKGYPNNLSVTAQDETHLRFTLSAPCPCLEELLTKPVFMPLKRSGVPSYQGYHWDRGASEDPGDFISCGPFLYMGVEEPDDEDVPKRMVFVKDPDWVFADQVALSRIEVLYPAEDEREMLRRYLEDEVDLSTSVALKEDLSLADSPELVVNPRRGLQYLALNLRGEPFADRTAEELAVIGRAMSLLIDRQFLCDYVGGPGSTPALGMIPPGVSDGAGGVTAARPDPGPDPAQARELLESVGFRFDADGQLSPETPLQFTCLTNDSAVNEALVEFVEQDLAVLGIDLVPRVVGWATYLSERDEAWYGAFRFNWVLDLDDPLQLLELFTTASSKNDPWFSRGSYPRPRLTPSPTPSNPN